MDASPDSASQLWHLPTAEASTTAWEDGCMRRHLLPLWPESPRETPSLHPSASHLPPGASRPQLLQASIIKTHGAQTLGRISASRSETWAPPQRRQPLGHTPLGNMTAQLPTLPTPFLHARTPRTIPSAALTQTRASQSVGSEPWQDRHTG